MRTAGLSLNIDGRTRDKLEAVGFVDVSEAIIQLPINPWSSQKRLKELGEWFHDCLSQAVHSMSMAALTRIEQWSKDDVLRLVEDAREEARRLSIHAYCKL
ncbi:uncharacterized protein B0I36DRAFT_396366 [Microdochium trichocladiopsis]|uniref:Uncharacterized protein n=1 Tax=Microdochium trichocladiopsis TaxID=1682393 RepID=A0A9P8XT31_9PEZI|nr:uncharacterized protein B0I36DRAFT_396366 [Microdochium trichocladiopsis]KAH7016246.1 hypothetical protein B0I36DRAFT_396366 [Microdochium trichocladiopsis]